MAKRHAAEIKVGELAVRIKGRGQATPRIHSVRRSCSKAARYLLVLSIEIGRCTLHSTIISIHNGTS